MLEILGLVVREDQRGKSISIGVCFLVRVWLADFSRREKYFHNPSNLESEVGTLAQLQGSLH